ncbi:hypothetical protein L1787_09815 [Acuticoccus sp. M5D2P5]|uniref:hypothetical protein n=1 Tax=Acuticoccus kalidii TaxID=2910977 RepID=UPI001F1A3A17|nr:hypothetical protein [Acuticoccus kalidii]MCF3933709.1 hypothetical protein [Acuticoccus kalidii]
MGPAAWTRSHPGGRSSAPPRRSARAFERTIMMTLVYLATLVAAFALSFGLIRLCARI